MDNPVLYKEEGRKLANTMKAVFLETSAKDNQCASDVFFKSLMQIEKVKPNTVHFTGHANMYLRSYLLVVSFTDTLRWKCEGTGTRFVG